MLFTLAQSGGGGNLSNYLHLIVVIIALSAGAIGTILKKLAEQRAIRNQKLSRERQRESMLRTGRQDEAHQQTAQRSFEAQTSSPALPNMVPEDEARRRLQELAQRRRAELAEMARRTQAGSPIPPPPPTPAPQPARQRPTGHSPFAPPPAQPMHPRQSPPQVLTQRSEEDLRRARNQAAKQRAAQEKAARKAAAQAERQREQELRRRQQRDREETQREADEVPHLPRRMPDEVVADAARTQARPTGAAGRTALGMTTAEDWRRAFITAELLKPPLSMREDDRQNF